jgi:cytochrome c biogenesis protein
VGLCGSLFIRPRRVWLRVAAVPDGEDGGGTRVDLAALDRSGGGDTAAVVDDLRLAIVEALHPTQEDR